MTEIQNLANKIKNRYGTVKRARGSFLYTEKRIRLTDLFLEGGRAILGWGAITVLRGRFLKMLLAVVLLEVL